MRRRRTVWLKAELEKISRQLSTELEARHLDTIETKRLQELPALPHSGTKPLYRVVDPDGHTYILKLGEPSWMAAEQAAYKLRRLGRRPVIPARVARVEVVGRGVLSGVVKPYVGFDPALVLSPDTTRWSELQRAVILIEQAWEWFLDNLDSKLGQYALMGARHYPLNIDWDRSFFSEASSPLSRFAKYKSAFPNARTFLYADYVEGKVHLPFELLMREAHRIRKLPRSEVRLIAEEFAKVRYDDPALQARFVGRVLQRQRRIERETFRFVSDLQLERLQFKTEKRGGTAMLRSTATVAWHHWQLLLHRFSYSGVMRGVHGLLKLARTARLLLETR